MKTKILTFLILSFLLVSFNIQAQEKEYYFTKTVSGTFEEVTEIVKETLKLEGFSVITEINMHETLKEKLSDVDLKPYRILGVCNANFAYQSIQLEENIGIFLPCKILIKQIEDNTIEVVMVNPSALMRMLENDELINVADEVSEKFKTVLSKI
ncbi:DUF302 domain-containing protein [candidate division KSB1 bacterium]